MPEYSGNPTGAGNPPGGYSKAYMTTKSGSGGHFVTDSGYQGSMNVGINASATVVGNQPKQSSSSTLESKAKKENPLPKA